MGFNTFQSMKLLQILKTLKQFQQQRKVKFKLLSLEELFIFLKKSFLKISLKHLNQLIPEYNSILLLNLTMIILSQQEMLSQKKLMEKLTLL